jgi:hypothetical protein
LDPFLEANIQFSEQKNHFFKEFSMKELNVEQMAALEGGACIDGKQAATVACMVAPFWPGVGWGICAGAVVAYNLAC